MKSGQEEQLLIDRYLDGTLSGVELQRFMERLESDLEFRKDVSLRNLLQEGIQQAADYRMRQQIEERLDYKKAKIPLGLRLIITFLLITLAGSIFWNYIDTNSNSTRKNIFSFSFLKNNSEKKSESKKASGKLKSKEEESGSAKGKLQADPEPGSEVVAEGTSPTAGTISEPGPGEVDSMDRMSSQQQEIVIKKDQLLMTRTLSVVDKHASEPKREAEGTVTALEQSAIEKLNPAAGLVAEEPSRFDSYDVEFWLSPINYRGYKLIRNKLILFGIEEPDAVRLYRYDGELILKYGVEYFRLIPSSDFNAYQRARENDFPLSQRQ